MTRLLVVDDNTGVRLVLRTKLETMGWNVDEAGSGDEALAQYRATVPDIVILDQRMPGRSGLDVAKELRALGFSGCIIIYSAYLRPQLEADAHSSSVVTVANTGFSELVTVLRQAEMRIR